MAERRKGQSIVLTYHSASTYRGPHRRQREARPQATEAGRRMLAAGGNAADAFVAATMAEYVVAEGGTSIAGTLGALVLDGKSGTVRFLDADYNQVLHSRGLWRRRDGLIGLWKDRIGKATLVPGALGGLEELSQKYGRLGFARALEPAVELAANGFPISNFYSAVIGWSAKMLRRSAYGRSTFFRRDGAPLRPGEILRQPEVARFLTNVQSEGAAYMYSGAWADECVAAVGERGGRMTLDDLERWKPAWHEPWRISYRGYDLFAPSGRQFGGIWVNLALLALEDAHLGSGEHFSRDADALEVIVRTAREAWAERSWFEDPARLDDRKFIASRITRSYAKAIAERVRKRRRTSSAGSGGSHSYHVITADADGNVVTGTNTIASLPWGHGTFVQGIPLNVTGLVPSRCAPGERIVNALTGYVGLRDGVFQFATGAFTNCVLETNLQFLVNLIDYQLPADRAAALPRFGTFPHSLAGAIDHRSNWLDPAVDASMVNTLRRRGLRLRQSGPLVGTGLDVGLGAIVARSANGRLAGALAPWPGLNTPWRRESRPVKARR